MSADLRARKIKKREYYIYVTAFIASVVLGILSLFYTDLWSEEVLVYEPPFLRILELFVWVASTLFSIGIAYSVNQQGDKKDFWYRYLSLIWPISIILIVPFLILWIVGFLLGILDDVKYQYADFILLLTVTGLDLLLVYFWMKRTASIHL